MLLLATLAVGCMMTGKAAADELLRFTTPATNAGIRGNSTVTYHEYAHPRSRGNFTANAVFKDPDLGNNVVMIAKSGDQTYFPGTGNEDPDSDTHDVLVGRSNDGGDTFYFRRVLQWDNGMRMVRLAMVPDPARHQVWVGTGQVAFNIPDSAGEDFKGTTRIEIDWANKTVSLPSDNMGSWNTYNIPAINVPEPTYFTNDKITHIASVTVNGQQRFEAWASMNHGTPSSTYPPNCNSPSTFDQNKANYWANNNLGRRIAWYQFTPENGVDLSSRKFITSSIRSLPTAYPRSDQIVTRAELGNQEFLYVGTQDQIVCDATIGLNSNGSSVKFIKLQYNATTDNYNEVAMDYLLDLSNPSNPNWACTDPDVRCHGTNLNHYSMVSAIPYQDGSQMQLYVSKWGGAAPTLPEIGEVGTVTASHLPTTVNLQRTYTDPVVFVQPPSWTGGQPTIARISDVTSSSFKVRLQEDSGLDGSHAVETMYYFVFERGTYRLSDKRVLEVDKMPTSSTITKASVDTTSWSSSLHLRDMSHMDTGIVIFTQLQTMNDPDYAVTRHIAPPNILNKNQCNPLDQCGNIRIGRTFFGIDREELSFQNNIQHGATEEVGVLAIGEKWLGRSSSVTPLGPWGAQGFDIRRVQVSGITYGWTPVTFEQPLLPTDPVTGLPTGLSNPALLAWSETRLGGNPINIRHNNLTSAGVDLAVDEDKSFDDERVHPDESVIFFVVGREMPDGVSIIRGQPLDSVVDQMF